MIGQLRVSVGLFLGLAALTLGAGTLEVLQSWLFRIGGETVGKVYVYESQGDQFRVVLTAADGRPADELLLAKWSKRTTLAFAVCARTGKTNETYLALVDFDPTKEFSDQVSAAWKVSARELRFEPAGETGFSCWNESYGE